MAGPSLGRRACRCCCCSLVAVIGLLCVLVGVLLPPDVGDAFSLAIQHAVPNTRLCVVGTIFLMLRDLTYCLALEVKATGAQAFTPNGVKAVYLRCFKAETSRHFAYAYGWTPGVAPSPVGLKGGASVWGPVFFSHAGYKEAVYNPKAGRPMGMFLLSNKSQLPPGVIPESVEHVLLEFDTGHPEWKARRQLMADALTALHKDQPAQEAVVPPGVSPRDGANDEAVQRVLGVTLFKWLFGVDVTDEIESILEYDVLFTPAVFGGFSGGPSGGKRLAAIRATLESKVAESSFGKSLMALATERGMDAKARLQEVIWIVLFAAFGGTSNFATQTLKHILRDPSLHIPLFRRDREAFMLEAARLYPPVGGMNFMELRAPLEMRTVAGGVITASPGTWALTITSGANNDPTVFEDPAAFKPGRANADRVMTWNAELRDIRAGTAPRGCPGTHLAIRLATAVVSYFVAGTEEALGLAQVGQGRDDL